MFLPRLLVRSEKTQNPASYFYTSMIRIEEIKRSGNLPGLAQMWIERSVDLDPEQSKMILQVSKTTLVDDPDKRLPEVETILHYFDHKR